MWNATAISCCTARRRECPRQLSSGREPQVGIESFSCIELNEWHELLSKLQINLHTPIHPSIQAESRETTRSCANNRTRRSLPTARCTCKTWRRTEKAFTCARRRMELAWESEKLSSSKLIVSETTWRIIRTAFQLFRINLDKATTGCRIPWRRRGRLIEWDANQVGE